MTEDEAKKKWCPAVRFHGTPSDDCIPNRSDPLKDATRCIGSGCMAWRVVREEVSGTDADGFGYVRSAVTGGYCGLAGAPQ